MESSAIKVSRRILQNGLEISLQRKKYQITYPVSMWKEFPDVYRQSFADNLTYTLTMHLCLNGHQKVVYDFPHPAIEPYVFESMMYSLGETTVVGEQQTRLSSLLKLFYNRNLNIEFDGRPRFARIKNVSRNTKRRALIPFSFGKDSLLTFSLCRELGVSPYPVFFQEPKSPFENRQKSKLADRFAKEFSVDVQFFTVSAGRLRHNDGNYWGWDLLFTQYTLMLIPYLFGLRARYLFWSHEQDCNVFFESDEGYKVNLVFEQTKRWLMTLNNFGRNLGSNSLFASLIEPINEIATTWVLHHRYPEIAKYQFSCFAEEPDRANRRWCGKCDKCVMMNIFLLALGINPRRVGLKENLFTEKKKPLYLLFRGKESKFWVRGKHKEDLWRDEQLLAFFMAYKNGAHGKLIDEFKRKYLSEAKSRERELREKMFGIHSADTLPYELKKPILKIFKEELSSLQ